MERLSLIRGAISPIWNDIAPRAAIPAMLDFFLEKDIDRFRRPAEQS